MKLKYVLFTVSLLLMSVRANATFSIIAYDSSTNQFGAALASCAKPLLNLMSLLLSVSSSLKKEYS